MKRSERLKSLGIQKDLTGKRFGRLVALWPITPRRWVFRCNCGKRLVASRGNVNAGWTKSCGCYRKDICRKRATKHGWCAKRIAEYRVWTSMRERCRRGGKDGRNYADRGIKVCKRWECFPNFLKDMGKKPTGYTIERINNNKGYFPSNCKWATHLEQNRNTRTNRRFSFDGKRMLIPEWAMITGIPKSTLWVRVRRGWPLPRVFTEAVRRCRKSC